jgi:hypothetical protein
MSEMNGVLVEQNAKLLKLFLESYRWPLSDEKNLQATIVEQLCAAGTTFEREVRLGPGDVVDFLVHGVAIEVKIKGAKRNVFRQCKRYCGYDRVAALILATNFAMGFPAMINGKSVYVANLGKAWL